MQIALVKKQYIDLANLALIPFDHTRLNDTLVNRQKGVHSFLDDYKIESIYRTPYKSLERVSQYRFALTPDYSMYQEMDYWRQLESVAHNRWVGAFWQSKGLNVITSVSWSNARSFDFCFEGIEPHSIVAVGMIGCKKNKLGFMRGYNAMLERIEPEAIICLGVPFKEMQGNILVVDYLETKVVKR